MKASAELAKLANMKYVNTHEAKTQLSKLIAAARAGEEVVICQAGKPVARLAPYEPRAEEAATWCWQRQGHPPAPAGIRPRPMPKSRQCSTCSRSLTKRLKLLLDANAFIWAYARPTELSPAARQALNDVANDRLRQHRLTLGNRHQDVDRQARVARRTSQQALDDIAATSLPITLVHVARVQSLPFHHRDPFDRMMIAQAMEEGTHDRDARPARCRPTAYRCLTA